MENNTSQNYPPAIEIVGGTIEVTSHLDGRNLIGGLWRTFFTGSLVQDGDYFMDRSRALLQRHLKLMQLRDQNIIRHTYDTVRDMRDDMENQSGTSQLRRNLAAREYRRHARKTYKLIKRASERGLDNLLRNQFAGSTRPPPPEGVSGSGPESGPGTGTAASDPSGDAHAISRITDINVNDVVRVDMSTYQDEATDEGAAVFDLISRDRSVKHVVAFAGDRMDRGASAPVPVSSHHDSRPRFIPATIHDVSDQRADEQLETSTLDSFSFDLNEPPLPAATSKGKRPDIIATSIPYVSDQRVDEQGHGETNTLNSFTLSDLATSEGNRRVYPVMRASVPPVDGDSYTRSLACRRPL